MVICFIVGVLAYYLLKSSCGCNAVVEGIGLPGDTIYTKEYDAGCAKKCGNSASIQSAVGHDARQTREKVDNCIDNCNLIKSYQKVS